jgi:hypothetical protein
LHAREELAWGFEQFCRLIPIRAWPHPILTYSLAEMRHRQPPTTRPDIYLQAIIERSVDGKQ